MDINKAEIFPTQQNNRVICVFRKAKPVSKILFRLTWVAMNQEILKAYVFKELFRKRIKKVISEVGRSHYCLCR